VSTGDEVDGPIAVPVDRAQSPKAPAEIDARGFRDVARLQNEVDHADGTDGGGRRGRVGGEVRDARAPRVTREHEPVDDVEGRQQRVHPPRERGGQRGAIGIGWASVAPR
jgi:hypothetical protein